MKLHDLLLPVLLTLLMVAALSAQPTRGAIPLAQAADRSEKRTALVIGNSTYQKAPLANPANDARDMERALRDLGFEVQLCVNATRSKTITEIRKFGELLRQNKGVGLFFFAGHGIQANGKNYIVPVDADIRREYEVEIEGVQLGRVMGEMADAGNRLNLVILDACRNNPYERSFRSGGRGLASIDAPNGTLIAYSTAPGSVAADGQGRNSPYTGALLEHMRAQNLPVEQIFKRVRAQVIASTGAAQRPWESSSLLGEFYFNLTPAQKGSQSSPPSPVYRPPAENNTAEPATKIQQNDLQASPSSALRSTASLVDDNLLGHIARKLNLNIKVVSDNFDSNTLSYTVSGKGFDNRYAPVGQGNIIRDEGSGLMWEQSGSKNSMNTSGFIETWGINYEAAKQHIAQLNSNGFGGYSDWRLPTLEEALTLIEPTITTEGVLKINPYFDTQQTTIWTCDRAVGSRYWSVDFDFGECVASPAYYELKVRAVRNAP